MRNIEDKKNTSFETAKMITYGNWIIDKWYEKLFIFGLIGWAVFSIIRWWLS